MPPQSGNPALQAQMVQNQSAPFWTQFGRFVKRDVIGKRKDFYGAIAAGLVLPVGLFVSYLNRSLFFTELITFVGLFIVALVSLFALANTQTQRIYTRVTPTLTYFAQVTTVLGGVVTFGFKVTAWQLS